MPGVSSVAEDDGTWSATQSPPHAASRAARGAPTGSRAPHYSVLHPLTLCCARAPVVAVVGDAPPSTDESMLLIKREWQPSVRRRKRKHGFLSKIRTPNGRSTLARRKRKGRKHLAS